MIKKTIEYIDFNGHVVTEDFYFNLTKVEMVELEVSEKEGLGDTLREIVASRDNAQIVEHFKKIILLAYGVKSEDGRRFIKNQALRDEFEQTPAFSELFIELATNAGIAAEFVAGIMPKDMEKEVQAAVKEMEAKSSPEPAKDPTTMTREELIELMRAKTNG